MKIAKLFSRLALLAAVSVMGCNGSTDTQTSKTNSETSVTKSEGETQSQPNSKLVSVEEYNAAIAEHKGKVVVVSLWASW